MSKILDRIRTHAYAFDNAGEETRRRFVGLPALYDATTKRHLRDRGVGPEWNCLEVGAGNGTIAAWLAQQVAPSGRVLATDIDTRFLDSLHVPCLTVERHDIVSDPLPKDFFDLIHARLVLIHLPERRAVLARLVAALKPGGWLVIEDYDCSSLAADPDVDVRPDPPKSIIAMKSVLTAKGCDLLYGRRLPWLLRAHGLLEVEAESRGLLCTGASLFGSMSQANIEQLREDILATGVTPATFDADHARMDDPAELLVAPVMWSAWGRRPVQSGD
jgi:SAM-dependent methyltransferase